MHNPVDIQAFLESSCVFGIHIGLSPIGRTPASQRRMEGFQMIGMDIFAGHRLYRVGMLWIGGLILRPFGAALLSLRPLILQPHFDSLSQCFLGTPSLASSQGFATQLK